MVGALKRDLLDRHPSDNALRKHPDVQVSRDTVGAWLRGDRFPQKVEPLLAVLAQIRAEAARRGLLDAPTDSTQDSTVAELLAPDRWHTSWQDEQRRRTQANQDAAQRQRAHSALQEDERRARQAALADRPRPVGSWSAQRLGVHPAIHTGPVREDGFVLPLYVPRPHDTELRAHLTAAAADGARPQMVVVRGASCTGKTRAAFEAVRAAVPADFDLLFPADADGLLAVLAADALGPCTVLWLNEAQDYLDGPKGEAVAAALLRRLDDLGPLIVVATLWPDHNRTLARRPNPGESDRHPKARDLLAQARYTYVPDSFTGHLEAVREAARDDNSLATAVQTGGVDLTQVLAAGPDLVEHYEHPAGEYGPYGRALISAAMDAHRLGVAGPLLLDFLQAAASGYLTNTERATARPDWFAEAMAYARTQVKATIRPLQEIPRPSGMGALPGVVRLADFLQQHGRRTRGTQVPPASFWHAATAHLTDPNDLVSLAHAAHWQLRYRHAAHLYCAAADGGNTHALLTLARLRKGAGDLEGAQRLARQAADAGNIDALTDLAWMREDAGDLEGAQRLARQAADAGNIDALTDLAWMREDAGDWEGAERFYRQAIDAGDTYALVALAGLRKNVGDWAGAERLAIQASDAGVADALVVLASLREEIGDRKGAEQLLRKAVDAGVFHAVIDLVELLKDAEDGEEAERLARRVASTRDSDALIDLAEELKGTGDRKGAEQLVLEAVHARYPRALRWLAESRMEPLEAYNRYGLDPEGTLAEPWEWPEPRIL
ncbi:hypothetical protein DFP74_0582 [Nocardiopsis sp. Huas11]|nr:hypothetical protein DFP74_0582 [Nocardiopsis sp. Huas11]